MSTVPTCCTDCGSVYEIKRVVDTVEEPPAYCVFCGSPNIKLGDENPLSYWANLARDLGLPDSGTTSADLVQRMFDDWRPSEGDHARFIDFAREEIKKAHAAT